jgi:hypothetical protein
MNRAVRRQNKIAKVAGGFDEIFWQRRDNCDTFRKAAPLPQIAGTSGCVPVHHFGAKCNVAFAQRTKCYAMECLLGVVVLLRR